MPTSSKRTSPDGRDSGEESSAGGVVVRGEDVLVIVPKTRAADGRGVLALPQGHLDAGETAEQAAAREVREEGGVGAGLADRLGHGRYWCRRGGRAGPKRGAFVLFADRGG